jgi:hypothetical protein
MTTTHGKVQPRKPGHDRVPEFQFSPRIRLTCERHVDRDKKGRERVMLIGTPLRLSGRRVEFRSAWVENGEPIVEVQDIRTGNLRTVRPERLRTLTGRSYRGGA